MTLSVCFFANSAPKNEARSPQQDATTLREQALKEHILPAKDITEPKESPATIKVQDPKPIDINTGWLWLMHLKIQQFEPRGRGEVRLTSQYDLSSTGSTILPELSLITLPLRTVIKSFPMYAGFNASVAFTNQMTHLVLPSGYFVDEAMLNTTVSTLGFVFGFRPKVESKISFLLNPQYGKVNYTMVSSSPTAQFNTDSSFRGFGLVASYEVNKHWATNLSYYQRQITNEDQAQIADIQTDNLQLGLGYTW